MKRILIVYNPRSSRHDKVRREVLEKVTNLKGYLVGKYEVKNTSMDANINELAKVLKSDDLVVTAGGDATSAIATNAILKSGKKVKLAVLPYGNFNDLSRTLGVSRFESVFASNVHSRTLYPLEIRINDQLVRYATCYVTIGMTAESVKIYDEPKVRQKLKTNFGRKIGSYIEIAKWYFSNRKTKSFLPVFRLNGQKVPQETSDYIAVNGRYLARIMRGGKSYLNPKSFKSNTFCLVKLWQLFKMMIVSVFYRVSCTETQCDILEFNKPSKVTLQAEGESISAEDVTKIEIRKAKKYLEVIVL